MMQLFIEGQEVDLDKRFSTFLNFALDDIRDFGARKTTFSKEMILPGTKRNNQALGNIFNINSRNNYYSNKPNIGINFNASVAAKAIIFNGNIQVFKGVLRLMTIIIDNGLIEYEVSVFGELTGFILALGNKKLEDLDFSAYNCYYTIANMLASKSNIGTGAGIVFTQNIDYGNCSANKHNWSYRTIRPAFHVKEATEKIIAGTNYSYEFPLLDTTRVKSFIVPHNMKYLANKQTKSLHVGPATFSFKDTDGNNKLINFGIQTILGFFVPSAGDTLLTYTSGANVSGTISYKYNAAVISKSSSNPFTISILKNGNVIASQTFAPYQISTATNFSGTIEAPVSISNGDVVSVNINQLIGTWHVQFSTGQTFLTIESKNYQTVQVNINEYLDINSCLPKGVFQKDFISSIVKLFNLYVYEDEKEQNKLIISPFIDIYANAQIEDWSEKLDRSSPRKIKPLTELTARYYDFDYATDSDYYNELYKKRYNQCYGSYRFDSQYQFSNDSKKVQIIFAGTPLVGYNGEDKVYSTIFRWNGGVVGAGEEQVDSVIRILQCKLITGVASWDILDGTTVLHSTTEYVYAGHLDNPDNPLNDLNFGVPFELFFELVTGALNINQFNVYWSAYMAEITDKDSRMLSAKFRLTKKDIAQLDFSKYKYIDGTLYRLSKIIDYNAEKDELCSVELLKVINKIY